MGVPYAEVIGDPIAHSKSPLIHKFWLEKSGIKGDYRACQVGVSELPDYFEQRRNDPDWRGCNVTAPYKQAVSRLIDAVDPDATRAGAVNTIIARNRKLCGINTDDVGFIDPLSHLASTIRSAILIGAGGAARGILLAMEAMGIETVTVVNRDQFRALALCDTFSIVRSIIPLTEGLELPAADLIVNATSLGMTNNPALHVSLGQQPRQGIIYDIVYEPVETDLLAQARVLDLTAIDGLRMLVGQAATGFQFLFGRSPPRHLDSELRELLLR